MAARSFSEVRARAEASTARAQAAAAHLLPVTAIATRPGSARA